LPVLVIPEIGPDFVVGPPSGPEKKFKFLFFSEIGPDFAIEPPRGPE
jgi:hypothetical protein